MSSAELEETLQLTLGMAGTLMTPEEFDAAEIGDDDYNYELIHGVLVVAALPLEEESDPNEDLGHILRTYQETHPDGNSLDATMGERFVHLPDSRRRADRVIWTGLGRLPDTAVDVPSIVVEFVSSGKRNRYRDYVKKREEYLSIGVAEYWVIDRFRRQMTVCRRGSADRIIAEHERYESELLPGFELPLARLFARADKWSKTRAK